MINPRSISCEGFFPKEYIILDIEETETKYNFWLMSDSYKAKCPKCGETSRSKHSYLSKGVQDLPILGKSVYLNISQIRYFCRNAECEIDIFTERTEFLNYYRRYTSRCIQYMLKVATHTNSEAASKILAYQGIKVSGDTLLNMLKEAGSNYKSGTARVIGVDDWAYRKGQEYGTLICDMETRKVIDVLQGRDSETLGKGLNSHPGIEIVSRDRASAYSSAVKTVLPEAVQIADRFHITKNLLEALDTAIKESMPQNIKIPVMPEVKNEAERTSEKELTVEQKTQDLSVKKNHQRAKTARITDKV